MAIGFKKDIQYAFYATRSGITSTRLRDHVRAYYIKRLGAAAKTLYLSDLERQWLRLVISTNGGTPQSNYLSALWRQACAIKNIPVTNMVEENQISYWTNVTSASGL